MGVVGTDSQGGLIVELTGLIQWPSDVTWSAGNKSVRRRRSGGNLESTRECKRQAWEQLELL